MALVGAALLTRFTGMSYLPSAREAKALMRRAMYWRTTSFFDLIKWSTVLCETEPKEVVVKILEMGQHT